MMQLVFERLLQGIFSAIGVGTLFYCYPVIKHIFSEQYRYKFKFEENSKLLFHLETIRYLRKGLVYGFIYGLVLGTIIGPFGAVIGI